MEVHVQFADATEAKIVSVFGCPQDPEVYPNQAAIDSSDARYQAFINPAPQAPTTVSQRQAHLALVDAGLYTQALALIAGIAEPTAKLRAEIEWNAPVYERQSVFLVGMANQLGLDDSGLDALFMRAAAL